MFILVTTVSTETLATLDTMVTFIAVVTFHCPAF
jgi:hypothetical protein